MDLFNHWQSESIQSFELLVFYINTTDHLLEHVCRLSQQCEQPETGSTAQGFSHTLSIEFNSSWAAKIPYQCCGSVSQGERTLATAAWILSANAVCLAAPRVERALWRAKFDTWADLIWAFGNWDDLCTCTHFLKALKNFIIQFLVLAGQGWDATITTRCGVLWPLNFLQSWGKLRTLNRQIKNQISRPPKLTEMSLAPNCWPMLSIPQVLNSCFQGCCFFFPWTGSLSLSAHCGMLCPSLGNIYTVKSKSHKW